MYQIYGVKITGSEKERRYYGSCETKDETAKAVDVLLLQCDYAYAKQIGVGTVLYRETVEHRYRAAPLQAHQIHRQFPG